MTISVGGHYCATKQLGRFVSRPTADRTQAALFTLLYAVADCQVTM